MKPVTAARSKPTRNGTVRAAAGGFSPGSGRSGAWRCTRTSHVSTAPPPTAKFSIAAIRTVPDSPNRRITNSDASTHAVAEPKVLTEYSAPTDCPTFRVRRTQYATNRGSVPPISIVGTISRDMVTTPVSAVDAPAVNMATRWNKPSENRPNSPIPISMAPKAASSGSLARVDSRPPAMLPIPNPAMKAVTVIVTDSMFTP